jgi:predicted dinucleotide-utilizing enzyme
MEISRQKVALVAVGNLGKYVCEELLSDNRFEFIVVSRQASHALSKVTMLLTVAGAYMVQRSVYTGLC